MHIVYASASCIPSRFANSINVMKMCQGFARLGHHVDLYAPNAGEFEQGVADLFSYYGVTQKFSVEKLPAPRYPSWPGRIVYASNYALRAWRCSSEIAYGRDWPALLMAAELGYDTILEMHAPAPKSGPKRLLFDRLANSKHLLRIVVNSEALRDDFAESFPRTERLLLLARNGADPIEPDPDRPLAMQRNGRVCVGYIGHLYPGRGMEILRDFAELCPWAVFHIVGGWPEDVAFWKQRIGEVSNVTFHGHVAPSHVPDFLHAMDVLIAPYQPVVGLEGGVGDNSRWVCPLKVFDYMAAGKPIICSDHAVLREILTHEQDALLCRPTDVSQWADALRQLRDDHDLADALATRAHESFKQQYSWDARARESSKDWRSRHNRDPPDNCASIGLEPNGRWNVQLSTRLHAKNPALELRNAFETKLIELSPGCADVFAIDGIRIGLETHGAEGGEKTVGLVAQDMRDFCLFDFVEIDVLERFAEFLVDRIEARSATRVRIGPLMGKVARLLKERLQARESSFFFEDSVLSIEPLLDKGHSNGPASKQSLRRALRKALQAELSVSSETLPASAIQSLHERRWGKNRCPAFFDMMHAFAGEPYCECISLKDASCRIVGQQLDFCFFDQRSFYYAVTDRTAHSGLGTALLSESIRRFYEAPSMMLYSFGRGGEQYKYRYAQSVRLNHYILGFRANGRSLFQ